MFKLNFKIALRNLWKNKGYTFMNIFGLSVGLAGFIMILLYANYERSYDTWNPEAKNLYRLSIAYQDNGDEYASTPGELIPALKNVLPEIEGYGRMYGWDSKQRLLGEGNNQLYIDNIRGVDSCWFGLFPYKFMYGEPKNSLMATNSIVLSNKTSEKLFGKANPVGKSVLVNNNKTYTVTGVFESPATPEHLDFDGFVQKSSKGDGWDNSNFITYIKATKGVDKATLEKKINAAFRKLPQIAKDKDALKAKLLLMPVTDIYLYAKVKQDGAKRGNPANITILMLLAGLLLFIACINFTNLSIAQSAKRAKETGVRKVLGAAKNNLVVQFLTETSLQCILALLIGLALIEICLPPLNNTLGLQLSIFTYAYPTALAMQIVGVLLLVILFAGGYAAFFLSGYDPVKVLKGNFSRGMGSLWLRRTLIVMQFVIATVFIAALMVINKQVDHMKHQDAGFNRDQVVIFKIRKGDTRRNFDQVKQRLLQIPGVKMVSRVNYFPGAKDMQTIGRDFNGETVRDLSVVTVDYDYMELMGMRLTKGRLFSKKFVTDSTAIMVNEAAFKKYGLNKILGKAWIDNRQLVGVVKNHIQKGMETSADPTAFMIEGNHTNGADNVVIKIQGRDAQATLAGISQLWTTVEPFPFNYTWLDQSFAQVYIQYERLGKLFMAFTYVTLFIAMLGLFALAAFTAQQRTKEIGIRKVLGADTMDIIRMINRGFIWLIVIANLIAIPLAYVLVRGWLNGFAYRAELTALPFIIALASSLLVTIITVSIQSYRAANANPVNALKYE